MLFGKSKSRRHLKMKKFKDRLLELRAEIEPQLENRMVFLLNPKDTKSLEAVSAWSVQSKKALDIDVDDNATLEDLWDLCPPDLNEFAETLNVKYVDAMKRFHQLKKLEIIYPDGSVSKLALQLVGLYIRTQATIMEDKIKRSKG